MVIRRKSTFTGLIQALRFGNNIIKWTTSERLLGISVDNKSDNKLSLSDHAANVAKSFASKLSLLRRMQFLPRKQLEDFYTKVIMASFTYGLVVWDRATRRTQTTWRNSMQLLDEFCMGCHGALALKRS